MDKICKPLKNLTFTELSTTYLKQILYLFLLIENITHYLKQNDCCKFLHNWLAHN